MTLKKKVRKMYTDPNRVSADIPGTVEGNPVFEYLNIFCEEKTILEDYKAKYREGNISDVTVKDLLFESLRLFLQPIWEKRAMIIKDKGYVEQVIYEGSLQMREIAAQTLKEVKSAMGLSGMWNKLSKVARERLKQS